MDKKLLGLYHKQYIQIKIDSFNIVIFKLQINDSQDYFTLNFPC